jgi:Replication protein
VTGVMVRDGSAYFEGLVTCCSIWGCPVCSVSIRTRRALEIAGMVDRWLSGGGGVVLLTLTTRHALGEELGPLFDAVANGWRSVHGGRSWKCDVETYGIVGWARAMEVTHLTGWHPHLHLLVFMHSPLSTVAQQTLGDRLYARWAPAMGRAGRSLPDRVHGVDVRPVGGPDVGTYVAGLGRREGESLVPVGLELMRHDLKVGRRPGSMSAHALLVDFALTGDVRSLRLLHQFEAGTFKRRCITYSRGIRELLSVEAVSDDEVLAETTAVVVGDRCVAVLPNDALALVVERGWRARVLNAAGAADAGDETALRAVMAEVGGIVMVGLDPLDGDWHLREGVLA